MEILFIRMLVRNGTETKSTEFSKVVGMVDINTVICTQEQRINLWIVLYRNKDSWKHMDIMEIKEINLT